MTIKSNGGVFGRNPTFNNVSVDGTLNAAQNIVMALGKGIDFSATAGTGTSELFSDYEEGTFLPEIAGTTTAGTGTYSSRAGFYTKMGNIVNFNITFNLTAHTGTGNMIITGLPFTSTTPAGFSSGLAVFSRINGSLVFPANSIPCANVLRTNTTIELLSLSTTGGGATSAALALDTVCAFNVTGFYYAV